MTVTLEAPVTTRILRSAHSTERDEARALVRSGELIAAGFGSVFGLVGDGSRPSLGDNVAAVKGRARLGRPLSVCLPSSRLRSLIDLALLSPTVRAWVQDADGLAGAIGSRAFLRIPLRASVARDLPPHLVSYLDGTPYLQSLDPCGIVGIHQFMTDLWRSGVQYPAITSMNLSGSPEIVEFGPAFEFARHAQLRALLVSPMHSDLRGSLSILQLGPKGLSVGRVGTHPIDTLQRSITLPIAV